MKILFLDVNQTETATEITKLNTYQQYGMALAYFNLGHDVSIGSFNKVNYKPLKTIDMNEVNDLNDFNIIFLTNYVLNFFGGVEIPSMTKSFKLLHEYKGKIVYLLSDFEMKLKQYEPRDEWVGPHNNEDYKINDYEVVVHSFNKELTEKLLDKKIYQFPLQYSSFYCDSKPSEPHFIITDLIYCGSFRSGRREQKMFEYFFDTKYNVTLYGSIKEEQFKKHGYTKAPEFLGKFPYSEVSTQNQQGICTIIIGDKSYNNHFFTMRILEALRDGLIIFIDDDYDKNRILQFDEFHYVKNKHELEEKIDLIYKDQDLYKKLLDEQNKYYNRYTDDRFKLRCQKLLEEIFKDEN